MSSITATIANHTDPARADDLARLSRIALQTLESILLDPDQSARDRRLAAAVALRYTAAIDARRPAPDRVHQSPNAPLHAARKPDVATLPTRETRTSSCFPTPSDRDLGRLSRVPLAPDLLDLTLNRGGARDGLSRIEPSDLARRAGSALPASLRGP